MREDATMISSSLRRGIYFLLGFLVVYDTVLSTTAIFFPETWFKVIHDAPYVDPQGLLRRTGAVWAAFTLLQLLALLRWEREPWWLVLIAGVRLTEVFSDWTYLFVCQSATPFGIFGLVVNPPGNLAIGSFLVWAYLQIMQGRPGTKTS
jgi:hypothetical protein